LDLAINEQKEGASRVLSMINNPDFAAHVQKLRVSYDRANSSIELLNGLTQFASRFKRNSNQIESEKEEDARFQEALHADQVVAVERELPETARRFKVQAEDAVRENKFDDAADIYRQALNIAPLWPAGHYNRALVLGEIGNYESAIREMKRYLLLAPNASNVRAAQDQIYIWERKAGEDN
jgi:tetratricopeptide (TPR) repeat protein